MADFQKQTVQWFPGHMAKTRRIIKESLTLVDGVVELVDARIPYSSSNPELDSIIKRKPRIVLLNKCDIADPNATKLGLNIIKITANMLSLLIAERVRGLMLLSRLLIRRLQTLLRKIRRGEWKINRFVLW